MPNLGVTTMSICKPFVFFVTQTPTHPSRFTR
jgi:hypothetical protein